MIQRHRVTRVAFSLSLIWTFAASGAQQLRADEPTYNELRQQFESAYADKDYQKALDASKKLHEARPKIVAHIYNIACMNCLLGNKDEAYKWLDKLADSDFKDAEYLAEDADFRTMQAEKRFREIVAKIRGEKPAADDKPERKIKKLDEDKPKKQDAELSPRERVEKIQSLTQELIRVADKDGKHALELSIEAYDHAVALQNLADKDGGANPRLKTAADQLLGRSAYNVACMYARLDKKDDAFEYLNKAVDHKSFEQDMVGLIKDDTDLDSLRTDARYAKVMDRLGEKAAAPDPRFSDDKLPEVDKMSAEDHYQEVFKIAQQLVNMADKDNYKEKINLARKALAHAKVLMDQDSTDTDVRGAWSIANYNAACMYSLNKDADAAFFYLNRAVDAGGFGRPINASIKGDSDFDNIRNDDRYKAVMEKADRVVNRNQRRVETAPEPKEKTVEPQWKITLPKNYDASKATPLVVALHHFNGNMNRTTDRWRKAADDVGAILLTPQGTVETGDGMYHWGHDIDTIERNVMKAIDKVMDEHKVDQKKIVLVGFSQGGWATWAIAARNPDTFRGIIPVCGAVKPDIEKNLEDADIANLRVWIMLGEDENSAVVEGNEHAAKLLKKAGAKVKLETYEGVGHGYPEDSDKELTKALHFILD
ncbi:MAG: dienelactone hydrolase family protein [Phycisphaerales bacterium]|nr:dienelactone hydrolase family protein [Phycisphaerales bacterium]